MDNWERELPGEWGSFLLSLALTMPVWFKGMSARTRLVCLFSKLWGDISVFPLSRKSPEGLSTSGACAAEWGVGGGVSSPAGGFCFGLRCLLLSFHPQEPLEAAVGGWGGTLSLKGSHPLFGLSHCFLHGVLLIQERGTLTTLTRGICWELVWPNGCPPGSRTLKPGWEPWSPHFCKSLTYPLWASFSSFC